MAKTDLNKILQVINNHEYEDLDKFLKKTDWFSVPKDSILPRAKVRAFVTSIADDEVRLAVMRFLQKYEDHYFKEEDNVFEPVLGTDPIAAFHRELSVQIEQLTSTGEFSGNRFSKLEKQVAQLKEENERYKEANQFLQEKIDRFENPHKYGKYIPAELNNQIFGDIMKYLQSAQIALPIYTDGSYGKVITCYQWYGKSLFGYFVIHVSDALNLKKGRDTYDWQIFEPAINNYDELIKEARKAISTCKKQKTKIEKSEKIDKAIQFAIQNAESEKH